MAWTAFGPGTVTLTVGTGTAESFEQEVKGGGVEHEYEDVGEDVRYLDGSMDPAGKSRMDTVTLECDFDLASPTGFYNYLFTHDLQDATITFSPNTAAGGTWSGTVRLQLPDGAVAEEFGGKISGTVELPTVGQIAFAPAGP